MRIVVRYYWRDFFGKDHKCTESRSKCKTLPGRERSHRWQTGRGCRCIISHINNIESASTHASAEVLVRISNALEVPIDLLLCDSLTGEANRMARIMEYRALLEDCDEKETRIIMGTLYALKQELKRIRK